MKNILLLTFIIPFLVLSCSTEGEQLQFDDNALRAGATAVVVTPLGFETFNDSNNNGSYEPGKGDTFNDCGRDRLCPGDENWTGPDPDGTEGNGIFDAIWIAGYGNGRPANGVHDDLYVRALVVSYNKDYFISITLDFVGYLINRVDMIKDRLEAKGIERDRVLITSIHNHQGPDTMGMWGKELTETGLYPPYMDYVVDIAVTAVEEAITNIKPAKLRLGQSRTRDLDPYNTGIYFGGRNTFRPWQIGIINDIRDPLIIDDLVRVMHFTADDGSTIATLFNFSGHCEVLGDENNFLSADYVGYARNRLEKEYGGVALYIPSMIGGMMSSLGAAVPYVDEDGKHVYELCTQQDVNEHNTCLTEHAGESQKELICFTAGSGCTGVGNYRRDYAGAAIPVIIEQPSRPPEVFDFARSVGNIVAETAISALKNGEDSAVSSINLKHREVKFPIDNPKFDLGLRLGIFEARPEDLEQGPDCGLSGCIPDRMTYIKFGDAELITIPGEMFPELGLGVPDDPEFFSERPNKYFRQHDDSDYYKTHPDPYVVESPPILSLLKAKYKFIFGLTNTELGYILPVADFYDYSDQGDHYEESNSTGPRAANVVLEAAYELTR